MHQSPLFLTRPALRESYEPELNLTDPVLSEPIRTAEGNARLPQVLALHKWEKKVSEEVWGGLQPGGPG